MKARSLLLTVAIALALPLLLAACGGDSGDTAPTAEPRATATPRSSATVDSGTVVAEAATAVSEAVATAGAGSPQEDPRGTQVKFVSVSAGYYGACGLLTGGVVVCWDPTGEVGGRYLGGERPGTEFTSVDIGRTTELTSVSVGDTHACGLRPDGSVQCWGNDNNGEATPPEGEFTAVSAGPEHTCAISTDGSAECWGRDHAGQATPAGGGVHLR